MKATDAKLERAVGFCETIAIWSTSLVFIGLVIEGYIAYKHPEYDTCLERWGSFISDVLVALGVLGELIPSMLLRGYQNELKRRSDDRLSSSIQARVELEKQLRARSINKEQFEVLQKLKGQISEIRIASDMDPEPMWFAELLTFVFLKIGIAVTRLERAPSCRSSANILCDKRAFSNPDGAPTNGEPLASILLEAGIPVGVLGGYPMDLRGEWSDDIPMLIIGNRVLPPEPIYLGPEAESAK